ASAALLAAGIALWMLHRGVTAVDREHEAQQRGLQALLDSLTVGVVLVNSADRRVLYANRRYQELTRTTVRPGDTLPSDHWDLERAPGEPYPPEERTIPRVLRTGKPASLSDAILAAADGTRTPVFVVSAPVADGPEGPAVVAVIQDRRDLD